MGHWKDNILLKIYTDTHKLFKEKMCWQHKIYNTLLCFSIFKHIMSKCSVKWDGYKLFLSLHLNQIKNAQINK